MKISKSALRHTIAVAVAGSCMFAGAAAMGQAMEVVTVEAVREIIVGKSPIGAPLKEVTIRARVSYADLDLTKDADVATLEKRVRDTAVSSCKEIKVDFPAAGSAEQKCVAEAVEGAMAQVRKAVEADRAAKK